MIKYILTVILFSLSIYAPTVMSDENWNEYDTYKKVYKWLTYSIYVTVKYNCSINTIDVDTILALIQSESNGDPKALSKAGAIGLCQIMPVHWKHAPKELYSIYLNIRLGAAYYKWCLNYAKGDKKETLRFYNAGPFSDKYVYKNYITYCDVIIRNSRNTRNLVIPEVVIR